MLLYGPFMLNDVFQGQVGKNYVTWVGGGGGGGGYATRPKVNKPEELTHIFFLWERLYPNTPTLD
jgi:hypothetical protein